MKEENKITNEEKEERVIEKRSSQDEYTKSELDVELEKLAQTFRDELKKAQEMSDEEFEEVYADEQGIITEAELCECCGERRKDKSRGDSYQYCSVCRENMKLQPLGFQNILVAVVLLIVAISSVITFTNDFYAYDLLYKAEKAQKECKLDTALSYYNGVITELKDTQIIPKKALFESADIIYKTMDDGMNSMSAVTAYIDTALTDLESKLPIYASTAELREECSVLMGTMQKFYEIADKEEYAQYDPENQEMYEAVMTEIGSIIDSEISVVSADGKTTKMLPASEAVVRFCQYIFAYSSEHFDDSYKYMLETEKLAPEFLWLYAYDLGVAELQDGNFAKAKELAEALLNQNIENADAYILYSSAERLYGRPEKSLAWANKGLEYCPDNAELMRYKAVTLCVQGEYEEAKKVIDLAISEQKYALLYFTAIVIENELGNTETVNSHKETLKEYEIEEYPKRLQNYLNGKITALELFTEGTGEVQ